LYLTDFIGESRSSGGALRKSSCCRSLVVCWGSGLFALGRISRFRRQMYFPWSRDVRFAYAACSSATASLAAAKVVGA